jgi:hypothetical protein
VAKTFHDDLRTHARGVTHCDADRRQKCFVHEVECLLFFEDEEHLLRDGFAQLQMGLR